jgi:hypothetical protein
VLADYKTTTKRLQNGVLADYIFLAQTAKDRISGTPSGPNARGSPPPPPPPQTCWRMPVHAGVAGSSMGGGREEDHGVGAARRGLNRPHGAQGDDHAIDPL